MVTRLHYLSIFLICSGLLVQSCRKENFDMERLSSEVELEPRLVGPLIYGSLNLGDLVEEADTLDLTEVDEEGLIYIVYSDTAFKARADTLVDIPDKLYAEYFIETDIETPVWLGSDIGDTVSFYKKEVNSFGLDGNDRVDSVLVKGGEIVIDVNSSFKHTGLLTISSSQILDVERDTFVTRFEISDPSGGFSDQKIFLSDGYSIQTTEINDTGYLELNFKLDLINSGNPVLPDEECEILADFIDLDFYNVFGYIDSRDLVTESGSFNIDLYENNPDLANLVLADPRLNIYASNSVGIPIEIELENVVATSSIDGSQVELLFTEGHPFLISAPEPEQAGEKVDSEIRINKNTSNFDELLASAPSGITYGISARTDTGSSEDVHFVLDSSALELSLEVVVPLDLKMSGFSLQDTFEFDLFEDDFDTGMIQQLELTLNTVNELPVQLEVQLYLMDSAYATIDSIFDETAILLGASQVDADGRLLQASEGSNTIAMSTEKIAKLPDVSQAKIVANLFTSNGGETFVKFYSQYSLDFDITMLADFKINSTK